MARLWHYARNGQAMGPVSEEQLRALIGSGAVQQDDLAWSEGLSSWRAIHAIPELAASPLPPSPGDPLTSIALDPPSVTPAPLLRSAPGEEGEVSDGCIEPLRRTRPWVRFFGVMGWITLVLTALGGVFSLGIGGVMGGMGSGMRFGAMGVSLLLVLLWVPPVLYLNRYASRIRDLMRDRSKASLEEALKAQKSFWTYAGILALISLVLYIVAIVGAVGMGAVGFMHLRRGRMSGLPVHQTLHQTAQARDIDLSLVRPA